jgi:NADP-dependent 3-hydroxy acid dehydrogenase YdfG
MQLKPIAQQVVVIVGASSGIGRETALRFANQGAKGRKLKKMVFSTKSSHSQYY